MSGQDPKFMDILELDPAGFRDIQQQLGHTNTMMAARLGVSIRCIEEWRGGRREIPRPVALCLRFLTGDPDVCSIPTVKAEISKDIVVPLGDLWTAVEDMQETLRQAFKINEDSVFKSHSQKTMMFLAAYEKSKKAFPEEYWDSVNSLSETLEKAKKTIKSGAKQPAKKKAAVKKKTVKKTAAKKAPTAKKAAKK